MLRPVVEDILAVQLDNGCIPWFDGGHADPWDHVEAAMGLTIAGEYKAAEKAYRWLVENQLSDGAWWIAYRNGQVDDTSRKETNFTAYVATGVWHHFLVTGNEQFLRDMWPTVTAAMEFILNCQTHHGEVSWATDPDGKVRDDALVTGCSSIYKSLECAYNISVCVGEENREWLAARRQLGDALRHKPHRFDRTWESKARYSMDWFYPVLTGVFQGKHAKQRLQDRWHEFVVEDMGCRCVSDEPWVTVAESCELTMALVAAGEYKRAATLFSWLYDFRDDGGVYWTGWQYEEKIYWPDEKPTWTGGAILLAADALTHKTAASSLFTDIALVDPAENSQRLEQGEFLKES